MTEFSYSTILSTMTAEGVRTISLNRPGSLNAMNRALIDEVALAFHDANRDRETRAIVFTGEGRAFCAGDDRHCPCPPGDRGRGARDRRRDPARDRGDRVRRQARGRRHQNGWAVGGGFEWAINCDFPIWAESAQGFFPGGVAEPVRHGGR